MIKSQAGEIFVMSIWLTKNTLIWCKKKGLVAKARAFWGK